MFCNTYSFACDNGRPIIHAVSTNMPKGRTITLGGLDFFFFFFFFCWNGPLYERKNNNNLTHLMSKKKKKKKKWRKKQRNLHPPNFSIHIFRKIQKTNKQKTWRDPQPQLPAPPPQVRWCIPKFPTFRSNCKKYNENKSISVSFTIFHNSLYSSASCSGYKILS